MNKARYDKRVIWS